MGVCVGAREGCATRCAAQGGLACAAGEGNYALVNNNVMTMLVPRSAVPLQHCLLSRLLLLLRSALLALARQRLSERTAALLGYGEANAPQYVEGREREREREREGERVRIREERMTQTKGAFFFSTLFFFRLPSPPFKEARSNASPACTAEAPVP